MLVPARVECTYTQDVRPADPNPGLNPVKPVVISFPRCKPCAEECFAKLFGCGDVFDGYSRRRWIKPRALTGIRQLNQLRCFDREDVVGRNGPRIPSQLISTLEFTPE